MDGTSFVSRELTQKGTSVTKGDLLGIITPWMIPLSELELFMKLSRDTREPALPHGTAGFLSFRILFEDSFNDLGS